MPLWKKYGLVAPGWFRSRAPEPRYAQLSNAVRFRLALEESGGLFPIFGQFLAGRADLLSSPYLYELRKIRPSSRNAPFPRLEADPAGRICCAEGIRVGPCYDVFSAEHQNRPIVVEVYKRLPGSETEKSWDRFCREIRQLDTGTEAVISSPPVMEQFWDWLQIQGDIDRKRTIIENLQKIPDKYVIRFPRLIPSLQSKTCLVYEGLAGTPLTQEILAAAGTAGKRLQPLVEGILEQFFLLSLIDTEALLENFLLLPDGTIGFRMLPAFTAVPVEWHQELLQYTVSSVAGNTPRAIRMLCQMSTSRNSGAGEQELLSQISALQPELKVNMETPGSVTVLENYWRALARTPMRPPLFLHLFHRNLILLGQYNESVAPSADLISESLWPVLGRLIRIRAGEMVSTERGWEWIATSGQLFVTVARQMVLALERMGQDNGDVTRALEFKDSKFRDAQLNRRTRSLIYSAIALVVFLFSVRLAATLGEGIWPFLAKAGAVAAGVALCVVVAGIK